MHSINLGYAEACEHVRKSRHFTNPNSGFRKQLMQLSLSKGLDNALDAKRYEKAAKILRKMHEKR